MAELDLNTPEGLAAFKKKLAETKKNWPYDTSKPLTDAQLKESGANDVTDNHKGLGITVGVGGTPKDQGKP